MSSFFFSQVNQCTKMDNCLIFTSQMENRKSRFSKIEPSGGKTDALFNSEGEMAKLTDIPVGTRVAYRERTKYSGVRQCTGTVVAHYESHPYRDEDSGKTQWTEEAAEVNVDCLPTWWAYTDTDRFAPAAKNLKPIK